ncbi:unnamed protein product [Nippostrongylus brasiliensis]|uniref:ABC transporter ATP-binding protein/permease wht-1 (inferred by orthology to a C. elegans protein) n=1 Tax=Nippostrongylus brasiliensis TaxID=27835 RepID=A0A0N4XKN3_NIPBR|nr:unnamed protein product [Nippostrongylus brasiliensis]
MACKGRIQQEVGRTTYAVAALFGSTDVAMTFLPIFVIPMLAFGGFFITYDAIPSYFTWMSALSYFKFVHLSLFLRRLNIAGFGDILHLICISQFVSDTATKVSLSMNGRRLTEFQVLSIFSIIFESDISPSIDN